MLGNLFNEFINTLCKISEAYLYEGRFDDNISLFDSVNQILNLDEVRKEDKARYLIQLAKIKADQKFLKDFNYDDEMNILQEARKSLIY